MRAALDDRGGRHEGDPRFLLQVGYVRHTDVAHGGSYLVQALCHVVMQRTGVTDVGIDALLERQALPGTEVVALPVARPVGALAPVLFDVLTVYDELVCRGFVESGEISSEHDEIGAHGKRECHVVVVHDAAVGAYRDIDAGLLEVLVPGLRDLDESRRLTSADALLLSSDADRASTDADLDKIGSAFGEETEALAVDDVSGSDLYAVAVFFADEIEREFLPAGVAL